MCVSAYGLHSYTTVKSNLCATAGTRVLWGSLPPTEAASSVGAGLCGLCPSCSIFDLAPCLWPLQAAEGGSSPL